MLNSVAPLPRRPPLPRHALAARPRVHVLREEGEGVLGHLAVAGGVVEQERAFAARVEDLEDGDGVVELRVHVVAGPVARVVERIPRFPRLPFFGGILKGEPRTWVTPLFQEGSHGVTLASKMKTVLVCLLFTHGRRPKQRHKPLTTSNAAIDLWA